MLAGSELTDKQTAFALGQLGIGRFTDERIAEQRDITTTVTHSDHNQVET